MCLEKNKNPKSNMNVHVLRHVDFEGLGNIEEYFLENNMFYNETHLFNNEELPQVIDFELLLVMGGPMGIYDDDDYPWLIKEREFIRKVMEKGIKIIGICLGAQFLADCLGGQVYKGPYKEIGWFPLEFNQAFKEWIKIDHVDKEINEFPNAVFHWHGDTFSNPLNSISIALTKAGINQGFIYKNQVLAIQFHLEMSLDTVKSMVRNGLDEISDLSEDHTYIQKENVILSEQKYYKSNYKFLSELFDTFLLR